MIPGHPEIKIGQLWRALTHVRRFRDAAKRPDQVQAEKLLAIVRANEDCAFGKKHRFRDVRSVKDFQSLVPPTSYEDLAPYIELSMAGAKRQLTSEDPFRFATTSGTTARPKFIPITRTHLSDYTHAFQVHNYQMMSDYPDGASGRFLIIASDDEEGRVPCGLPYGAVSGLLYRRQPSIIRQYFALPYELCKIKDVDSKYYLMLRVALSQPVTAIMACNPSSLLLLADQMREHGAQLVKDIHDGSVRDSYKPPAHLAEAFRPYLRADRRKARELERLLEREGALIPQAVWPRLTLICCWKGGPMGFYLERLGESYGDVPVRDFGYMASEGRGSIPLTNDGAGGVAALTSHFFEFVPEEEMDSPGARFLTLDQLGLNRRYYIYFTTAAGLYRYNINDIVEVVGFYERTPVIQFVRKGQGISSITGEKLTEEQVRLALSYAVAELRLSALKHFTAAVQLDHPPYYLCFAELGEALEEARKGEFLAVFDRSLMEQNPEYNDKRATRRLGPPQMVILPPGTYTRLRQQRVAEGAPEAQVKFPLLSCRSDLSASLKALAGAAGGQ